MSGYFAVTGLKEALAKLESVSVKMRRQVSRKAVTAAARVIATEARRNAPRRTGVLKRAIFGHYSTRRSRRDVVAVALVRARSGKKEANRVNKKGKRLASRDAYYAGWVEFGHKIVARRGSRNAPIQLRQRREAASAVTAKRVEGREFMGKAYRSHRERGLQTMVETMKNGLDEAAR